MSPHPDPWPAVDHMSTSSLSHDSAVAQPAAPQNHDNQHQLGSHSLPHHEVDWPLLGNELDRANDIIPAVAEMYGTCVTSPIVFPRQSIEATPDSSQPQQHPAMNSLSPTFACNQPDQSYNFWPPTMTSAPVSTYPPVIPENCQWSMPQSFNEPMAMNGLPLDTSSFFEQSFQEPTVQSFQYSNGNDLRHDSPFTHNTESTWNLHDASQVCLDGANDDLTEGDSSDPCYAQLLFRCLKEADSNTLSLRELYEWVAAHSQKAKDPKSRGWQNSVRHNLSMNAAFERVQASEVNGAKKGSLWRLTKSALEDGVISTTRYRKESKRKPERRSPPALKRQISGAKGGQATRNATRRQQALHQARSYQNMSGPQRHQRQFRRNNEQSFFSPTPFYSHHSSPQPPLFVPQQQPSSPYFVHYDENSLIPPSSNPKQSPQSQMMFDPPRTPAPMNPNFQLGYYLVGNNDEMTPDTPSLATEASFMTDEGTQSLLSPTSRETTSFQ